jgi:cell division protein FtsQ
MRQIKIDQNDRPVRATKKTKKAGSRKSVTAKKANSMRFSFSNFDLSGFTGIFTKRKSGKSTRSKSKRQTISRKKPIGNWRKLATGSLAFAVLCGGVAYSGYQIVQNDVVGKTSLWVSEQRLALIGNMGLVVQEVSVVGRERTQSRAIMAALAVTRGESLVDFDPDAARKRIEALGWIEEASVMRRYPDEIFVRVQERRPFARWQMDKETVVIDRKGFVVSRRNNPEFAHLPKVVGNGANIRAAELFDMLAKQPALFTRLEYAMRVRDRRWNLGFGNGVKVMLPEEGTNVAWLSLNEMQQKRKILNKGVVSIDLRSSDRMYVRLREGDAEFLRTAGNET